MNQRLFGREVFWAATVIMFLWVSTILLRRLQLMAAAEYGLSHVFLASVLLVHVLFGVLLGLPWLFERWDTHAGFNWSKFLVQGLPALLFATPLLLILGPFGGGEISVSYLPWEVIKNNAPGQFVVYLAGVWFGKVLVDSVKGFKRAVYRRSRSGRFRPPPKIGWS